MGETDLQRGGGYTYQWECAVLLALNYFFEPVRYSPVLFDLVDGFLGGVAEIRLEGEDRAGGVDLEDIALINGDRRILIQVKTKQAEGERWTPTDPLLLKALYRFYDSRSLAECPEDARFVFLTNRSLNPDLAQVNSAVSEGTVAQCAETDRLCQYLVDYAHKEKGCSIDVSRIREMLARTTLVEYLALDGVKANVQAKLQAHGRRDWKQAHAFLFEHFARQSTRIGGGVVTRASVIDVLGPRAGAAHSEMEALNDYLARAVAAFEARMYHRIACSDTPPVQPYKFLYAFEIEDADIFFGRDTTSEAFHQIILKDRLTILHAKSGAGKTSLLNAGLAPRLIREDRLPVYARAYDDPVRAIKRAIASPSLGPWPERLPKLSLHEFLGLACAHLGRDTQELVIILDQFEEFFIFWPERDHCQPFIDTLGDCYDDKSLRVRFIIALRKDYYSDLATFQRRLPHIFHNEYRLDVVTRAGAQSAIIGPVSKLGCLVTYELALLNTLLDDLARGGMELPHLQIICTRLYEALAEDETVIKLSSYEKLGQAEGVLGDYLKEVLNALPGSGGAIARDVLKELVSSEVTNRVLSYNALTARVAAEGDELGDTLARLVDARLLRRDELAGKVTYEMAHEYLIEEVKTWIDQADLAFKQAEELLTREVANWRVYGTLIPRDRLELLHVQRERFRGWDAETWEYILYSALRADFAIEDWVELAGEIGENVLEAAIEDSNRATRRTAIRSLGAIWGLPELSRLGFEHDHVRQEAAKALGELGNLRAVGPLIVTLWDEFRDVRRAAVEALGRLGDQRATEPLVVALRDGDGQLQQAAAEALGEIGDPRAVEPLIAVLQDRDGRMRRAASEALGEIGDPRAVEPLIAVLQDRNGRVRRAGSEALGGIGDPRAVGPLIAALRDEDSRVRRAGAEALGGIGDPRAVEPLIAVLQDSNGPVRQAGAGALGGIGDPRAVEPLIAILQDREGRVRRAVSEALVMIGDPSVEPLICALRSAVSVVRRAAAGALGRLGDPRAVEPLMAPLRDEDWRTRRAVAGVLGTLGDGRAVKPLGTLLQDNHGDVRKTAVRAILRIGTPEALAVLGEWQQQ